MVPSQLSSDSIKEHIKCYQGFIDNNFQVSISTGPSGTGKPSGPTSTTGNNIGKVTPTSNHNNPIVTKITFKMNVGNSDAKAHGDVKKVLNNQIFQTLGQDIPMVDDLIEEGEKHEIDPLGGQQHIDPPGQQTPAQGQGVGQNPSSQVPRSPAVGHGGQSPAEWAAAVRNPGTSQQEDQFPRSPARTGTPRPPTSGPAPPVPISSQEPL